MALPTRTSPGKQDVRLDPLADLHAHVFAFPLFLVVATCALSLVRRCAELHMRQIAQGGDPFETGSARLQAA